MENTIYLIGLNYKTAGVDVRERFALSGCTDPGNWPLPVSPRSCTLRETGPAVSLLAESMVLSTCNRVELLVVAGQPDKAASAAPATPSEEALPAGTNPVVCEVVRHWAVACKRQPAELMPHIYVHQGAEAVRHLFRVASSLDSMVLGEPQILGQLKDAFRKATEAGATRTVINRLLHKAFSVAKRVRTETGVASSAVSISYAAVELAKRIFGAMQGQRALLMGAGEMAELAAAHLVQAGIERLYVTNRTHERAVELATRFNGEPLPFEGLLDHLTRVDIVISSTGSPEALIRARQMREVLKKRRNRPMFFIDIAVPRDIDPDVNTLDNVYLYDIDDLKEVVEENLAHRQDEAHKAQLIVEEEVLAFRKWLHDLALQPTLVDLVRHFERTAEDELARTLKRLGHLDDDTRAALEAMTRALAHKLAHDPLMFVKNAHNRNVDAHIGLVRRLFRLDEQA